MQKNKTKQKLSNQPTEQPTSRPNTEQPTSRPNSQFNNQSLSQPKKPTSQINDQPINKASQPPNYQPANPLTFLTHAPTLHPFHIRIFLLPVGASWYLPTTSHALIPPPVHQLASHFGLRDPQCDRLTFRNPRQCYHPYQRRRSAAEQGKSPLRNLSSVTASLILRLPTATECTRRTGYVVSCLPRLRLLAQQISLQEARCVISHHVPW